MSDERDSPTVVVAGPPSGAATDVSSSDLATDARLALEKTRERHVGRPGELMQLGRFRIGDRLGAGGMGVVYVAHDAQLDRDVAIKLLRSGDDLAAAHAGLDLGHMPVTCPANHSEKIQLGTTVHFPADVCAACKLRNFCTGAAIDRGRSISIAADERMQEKLRVAIATPDGREHLRQRVAIEHRLAHHARKQGTRARYRGIRKNPLDARRHALTINLETIHLANTA